MVQDGEHYNILAKHLLHDGSFPIALRSPGYPFFIAMIYAIFGEQTLPVFLVQAVLFSMTTGLLVLLGRDIFGENRWVWAYVPGVLVGLNPEFAAYSVVMLRENLTMFLLVLSTWLCLRMLKRRWWYGIFLGLSVGGLAYVRQEACLMIFAMMAMGVFFKGCRDRAVAGGIMAVVIIVVSTLPWMIYCSRTRGYFNMQYAIDSNLFARTWYLSEGGKVEPELREYIKYIVERHHLSSEEVRRYTIPPILVSELPDGDILGELRLYRQLGEIARENLRAQWKAYLIDSLRAFRVSMGGYWLAWWKGYWEAPDFSENLREGEWLVAGVKIMNRVVWPVVVLSGCVIGVLGFWRKKDDAAWAVTMIFVGTLIGLLPMMFLVEGSPRLRMVYDGFLYLAMSSGLMVLLKRFSSEATSREAESSEMAIGGLDGKELQ
jgi:hypothetical protein